MERLVLPVFCVITFASLLATLEISPDVVGNGVKAGFEDVPWIVSIKMSQDDYAFCAGTLIDVSGLHSNFRPQECSQWVVTAASCTQGIPNFPSSVVALGNHNFADTSKYMSLTISEVIIHEKFKPLKNKTEFSHDIALLKVGFSDPNKCGDYEGLSVTETMHENVTATTAGWGLTAETGKLQTELWNVSLPINTDKDCATYFGSSFFKPSSMMCAGAFYSSTGAPCSFDAGAPLVCQYEKEEGEQKIQIKYLCGLASASIGCGRTNSTTIFTDVVELAPWIKEKTK